MMMKVGKTCTVGELKKRGERRGEMIKKMEIGKYAQVRREKMRGEREEKLKQHFSKRVMES